MSNQEACTWQSPQYDHLDAKRPNEFPLVLKSLRWFGRQTWIPRGRDRVLRYLLPPDRARHFKFEVDFFGMRYCGDLAHYIDWQVFMYGQYASAELSILESAAKFVGELKGRAVNAFDIGAHVGHHTLFMSRFANQVFAFEPFSAVRSRLEEKLALNHIDNVVVLPVALGDCDMEMDYFPGAGCNSGTGTLTQQDSPEFGVPVKVDVCHGDHFIDAHKLPPMDIVKVDVEGFEPFVFRGLSKHIQTDRPVILTELSDATRSNLASPEEFSALFYEDAIFAGVVEKRMTLIPFDYCTAREVLVLPPEMEGLISTLTASQA
jgi:FkbM family methyltransferase